jgi:hypothetical protein
VEVAAQHSEAIGKRSRIGVKEGFFLDGVALHAPYIAPRNVESPATVEAHLANAGLAVRDRAGMPAGKTAHAILVELLVKLARASAVVKDLTKGRHREPTVHAVCKEIIVHNGEGSVVRLVEK